MFLGVEVLRKINNTSTLKTDMLFLLIAVSYILLSAVSFQKEKEVPIQESQEDVERIKVYVESEGVFEITEKGEVGARINIKNIGGRDNGIELYPSDGVSWRDVRLAYLFLLRQGRDVVIKPSGGIHK